MKLAAVALLLLVALALFLTLPPTAERPRDLRGAAAWLAEHPADWIAASIVSDASLDSALPRRFELWRDAHALADRLAPRRPNASAAFVRAGFFHWFELSEADRRVVLAKAVPLLRDPKVFESMHEHLWELTRDLRLLRRANPGTSHGFLLLRELASKNGLFDDYRLLREDVRRARLAEFQRRRAAASPGELVGMLPQELEKNDEPLVRALLDELRHRPLEAVHDMTRTQALIDFAIRHRLPLDGLHPLIRKTELPPWTRARLALAQNDAELAAQLEHAHWAPGMTEWAQYEIERAIYEAHRGDAVGAQMHLDRANSPAAALEVARILGRTTQAAPHVTPIELGKEPKQQELFTNAPATIPLTFSVVQSDRIAPYVEIFLNDILVAEGPVAERTRFEIQVPRGRSLLRMRITNAYTRGRIQRLVRLS